MSDITSITSAHKGRYYYTNGKRVELKLAPDYLFIDAAKAGNALMAMIALAKGTVLPGGSMLVTKTALSSVERSALNRAGAIRFVYGFGRGLTVPLPEVRVDCEPHQREKILQILEETGIPFEIIGDDNGQLTLHPKSDFGGDALDLANHLHERGVVARSSARMLQMISRPCVRG